MTQEHFLSQMGRLSETYGKAAYGTERAKLLWREIKDFDAGWFTSVVDRFIGSMRQAPLMAEFGEEIGKERERVWRVQKLEHKEDAREFMNQFSGDDFQMLCGAIRDRINGRMDDSTFNNFTGMLDRMQGAIKPCSVCSGSGLTVQETFAYRCGCQAGRARRDNYPVWDAQSR